MKKLSSYSQLYLRLALSAGYLTLGLDRLGVWGNYGQAGVSWGDWQHFVVYASDVMRFLPHPIVAIFAVVATICEIGFGTMLLLGWQIRIAATGSGLLTLCFGTSMAIAHDITDPINYSVFTVSAASFLLAGVSNYSWSLDNALQQSKTS